MTIISYLLLYGLFLDTTAAIFQTFVTSAYKFWFSVFIGVYSLLWKPLFNFDLDRLIACGRFALQEVTSSKQ